MGPVWQSQQQVDVRPWHMINMKTCRGLNFDQGIMNAWMHKLLRQGGEHILHIRKLISSLLLCKVLQGCFVECQPSIQRDSSGPGFVEICRIQST